MNTPTPRTDAAWSSSFEPCEYRAAHTARIMRECSQQLETELAALTAERDQLRVDLELADVMYQRECEVEHELRTEVERLRSDRDCEKRLRKDADEFRENAIARAERAEDNLAALEQCHDDNCRGLVRIADELATAKERLRSEAMDDYAAIKDLQRELAAERARLDWVFHNCKVTSNDFTVNDREDLGVAMKEHAK